MLAHVVEPTNNQNPTNTCGQLLVKLTPTKLASQPQLIILTAGLMSHHTEWALALYHETKQTTSDDCVHASEQWNAHGHASTTMLTCQSVLGSEVAVQSWWADNWVWLGSLFGLTMFSINRIIMSWDTESYSICLLTATLLLLKKYTNFKLGMLWSNRTKG